jgi:lysophospholipase L1-like esterase
LISVIVSLLSPIDLVYAVQGPKRGTLRHWCHQARASAVIRPPAWVALALVVMAGCGGSDPSPAPEREPRSDETVVAALGDSITAGAPLWDPDPALRSRIADPDRRSQYGYWAERALPGTRFRNCGVSGEVTDQLAARLDGCAEGAEVLIVQGGVNDIAQGLPVEAAAANLRAMVRRGKRLGLRVTVVELLPWNGAYPEADRPIRELNRRIAAMARQEGVPVIEWYDVLEDPRRAGRMRPRLTNDLTHPSVAGYRLLGEAVELPRP